jgi:tetratricopeptide (TPR) repeat protein
VALEIDNRAPPNFGLLLTFTWPTLAGMEARMGHLAAADRAYAGAVRVNDEAIAQEPEGAPRRALMQLAAGAWRARLQLYRGEHQKALENAVAAVERIRGIDIPADNINAIGVRDNFLRFSLTTVSAAALALGRYPQAEATTRERMALPPNRFGTADPQDERSRARVMLAHAVALQGRAEEARKLVQPEIELYRGEQKHGARGTSFVRDLAHALYVSAISETQDEAGRVRKAAALAEAAGLLGGLSAESRQLVDYRELSDWIGAARAGA